jgi:hypothetical protein
MKPYTSIYLGILFFSLSLHSEELQQSIQIEDKTIDIVIENSSKPEVPSISSLIEQIKSAKVDDKRVLMNQLKLQLREMNKESRQKAMRELKKSFSGKKQHTQKQYKQVEHKNLHQQQSSHQPTYHRLQNGQGMGRGGGHK